MSWTSLTAAPSSSSRRWACRCRPPAQQLPPRPPRSVSSHARADRRRGATQGVRLGRGRDHHSRIRRLCYPGGCRAGTSPLSGAGVAADDFCGAVAVRGRRWLAPHRRCAACSATLRARCTCEWVWACHSWSGVLAWQCGLGVARRCHQVSWARRECCMSWCASGAARERLGCSPKGRGRVSWWEGSRLSPLRPADDPLGPSALISQLLPG